MCSSAHQEEPPTPLKGENVFKHLRRDNDEAEQLIEFAINRWRTKTQCLRTSTWKTFVFIIKNLSFDFSFELLWQNYEVTSSLSFEISIQNLSPFFVWTRWSLSWAAKEVSRRRRTSPSAPVFRLRSSFERHLAALRINFQRRRRLRRSSTRRVCCRRRRFCRPWRRNCRRCRWPPIGTIYLSGYDFSNHPAWFLP